MFAAWGSWVARFRWPIFAITLAAVIAAGVWGMGVFGQLTEGGYNDPNSESARAAEAAQEALGAQGGDVVVMYTPARGSIDDKALAQRVANRLGALPRDAVRTVSTYWQDKAPQYASQDKRSAVALLTLAGEDDSAKLESYREVADRLDAEGSRTQVAGWVAFADASSTRSAQDLAVAEAVSLPVVLILLLFVFGSLVAAAMPVMVGGAAVLGSLGVLRAVAMSHDVNSFAVNVASLLGLGMAIDYGLFMVGRFREEQSYGRAPADAVARTVATAGRTVLFSATLLMIALGGLLLFPQGFLKSLAYGGLAAVALAALFSLTLLPALLAILGPRVDKLPIRLPKRKNARQAGAAWARLGAVVVRRPILVALPIIAGLLVLAAPIRGVQFGEADERVLPASDPARQAIETLKTDFPALSSGGVQVVLRGDSAADPGFVAALQRVPGVAAVTPAGSAGEVVQLTATLRDTDPFGTAARDTVEAIRAVDQPAGTEMLVGGTTARNVDSLEATANRLPLMIGLLVGATLLLMFLAFGSVLLPVKAVVVSALSLAATFGVLVWIFQDGHGAGLLQISPAPPEIGIVVLMAAVVFGLSTDYEVFLLSRMVEARVRGASTAEAVTTGLARTGRVISAAALLLIVVTGAFALSTLTTMRFVGIGMIIALVLDATVVRMLLVPAILGMLGGAAWWAPRPLRWLQGRAGLSEYEGEELFPTISVGRHAAPESAVARSSSRPPRHAADEPLPLRAGSAPELTVARPPLELPAGPSAGAGAVVPVSPGPGGEEAAAADPAASSSAGAAPSTPSATDPPAAGSETPEEPPRESTREPDAVRLQTGEHTATQSRTGEPPSVDDSTTYVPVVGGTPDAVGEPTGESENVANPTRAAEPEPSAAGIDPDPGADFLPDADADPEKTVTRLTKPDDTTADDDPEMTVTRLTSSDDPKRPPTIDLTSHIEESEAEQEEPAPETTAVLDMDPTADLPSGMDQEESRPRG